MGFLVGNDFIPNLPELHISSGALPVLYKAYREVLPTLDGMLRLFTVIFPQNCILLIAFNFRLFK